MIGGSPDINGLREGGNFRLGRGWCAVRIAFAAICACFIAPIANAQGSEDFSNIPTGSPGSYNPRSWTGTDGVIWTATEARTDQTLTGKAICTNGSGTVTSPSYAGGMGILQFNYVRAFTGGGTRTIQVWVNGSQVGGNITVSPSSNTVVAYSSPINVTGNVILELRTSGAQIKIDDIQWTAFNGGPTVSFNSATSASLESAGTVAVNMAISPAAVAGSITISINGSSTATYGAGNDYTTNPPGPITITVPVSSGATTASFDVVINNDAATELDETISFTITGVSTGLSIGSPSNHVFTILNDDNNATINFSTLTVNVLENNVTAQTFQLSRAPVSSTSLDVTITISLSGTATYGADYTTSAFSGNGSSGTFTVRFNPNQGIATFTATVINDAMPESTENAIFTITTVPVGCVIGSDNTATLLISDDDSSPTVLLPGDLVMVGVNARNHNCDNDDNFQFDFVSFFSFKEITYGTELILTDNGYERCNPGQWGNTEGTVRMKRTGAAIPAGQVVTFKFKSTPGSGNVVSVAPDAAWTCTQIGISGTSIALNSGGEQLFFMQGNTWNPGTSGNHNATYTGTILYAFSTNPLYPWSAVCSPSSVDHTDNSQRSNLPPGVECFSMAPTSASDFSKYTGPITPADQRDWIIRIDDTSNWSSYSSCAQYNASGIDWLTAPILPIIPGTMTHGLWRGGKDTDWFECKNWDDARIPDPATAVVINAAAIRNCDVGLAGGLNPGGTAVCASLLQNFGATALKSLTVTDNSTLNIGGPLTIQHTAGTGSVTTAVLSNATLSATDVNITGNTANNVDALLRAESAGSLVKASGNMNIGMGGRLDLSGTLGASGTLELGGNFTNTDSEVQFSELYSKVVFNGATNQSVSNPGFTEFFHDLQMNKTGGELQLAVPITIANELDLTQGRILTTATNLLTLKAGGIAINTSDASFVKGPMQKIGNTDFTFPIGKGVNYRPASVTSLTGGAGSAFIAEYFPLNPETAIGPVALPTTLHHISHCEYWQIDRSAGSPNARVGLSWDTPESCGVTAGALSELRVARWTGTNWDDRGNGGATGSAVAGEVTSAAVEAAFSPWTLASVTANNPLPIQLLSFTAVPAGSQVDLRWSTASEKDNDHFTVERSADAVAFASVSQVPGAGNSQGVIDYADVDPLPLDGLSYYRLRQTDLNGTSTVSQVVPVFFASKAAQPLTVLYGQGGASLLHDFPAGSTLEVLDLTGRVVAHLGITSRAVVQLPLNRLSHGVYVLRMSDGARVESTRLAY